MKAITFFIGMFFSSGLSFLRFILLALILSVVDFTYFATIIAIGGFSGSFISLGIVEKTFKEYPSLIVNNKFETLKRNVITIIKKYLRDIYTLQVQFC